MLGDDIVKRELRTGWGLDPLCADDRAGRNIGDGAAGEIHLAGDGRRLQPT